MSDSYSPIQKLAFSLGELAKMYVGDKLSAHEAMEVGAAFQAGLDKRANFVTSVNLPIANRNEERASPTMPAPSSLDYQESIVLGVCATGVSLELGSTQAWTGQLNPNFAKGTIGDRGELLMEIAGQNSEPTHHVVDFGAKGKGR
jgi:hypothetical protein